MGSLNFKGLHGLYLVWAILYLCGWIIALSGLSAAQHSCAQHESQFFRVAGGSGQFAPTVGKECHRLYRFAWFVLCLGVLPLIADAVALGHRKAFSYSRAGLGRAETWWAVLAVLDILVVNAFYNAVDSGKAVFTTAALPAIAGGTGTSGKTRARLRCALAGFAIAAAAALLLMWLAPYCIDAADESHDEAAPATSTQSKADVRGGVVPPAAPVETQAAGTGQPPQVIVA